MRLESASPFIELDGTVANATSVPGYGDEGSMIVYELDRNGKIAHQWVPPAGQVAPGRTRTLTIGHSSVVIVRAMGAFKTEVVDDPERGVVTIVGIVGVVLGVLGGFELFRELDGGTAVQSAFWTTLLTLSALSALPLVAMTTYICRLWFGSGTRAWRLLSPVIVSLAVLISLVGIVLCVYEIAVTGGSGDPHDGVLFFATLEAGAALGAAVFGVAFAVVDKID